LTRAQRRPFMALYCLYNQVVPPEIRAANFEETVRKYNEELAEPVVEALAKIIRHYKILLIRATIGERGASPPLRCAEQRRPEARSALRYKNCRLVRFCILTFWWSLASIIL
jgi:hypothetical protein